MVSMPVMRRSLGVRVMTLPTSPSIAHSLLACKDPAIIEQMTGAMDRLAIATEVCVDLASARKVLHSRKFDVLAIDFDLGKQAPGLLGEIRLSPSNRTAPTIAITRTPAELALAYCAGSNFVLQKPLSPELVNRMLNAGYGLVVRERRRYFRCRVRARVKVRRVDIRETQCHTVNVSEGGMEIISAPAKLVPGMRVHVEFSLPGRVATFAAVCETRWRNTQGRAGLRFLLMPLEQRCDLQEWLTEKLEESLPESVAERFRDASERFRSEKKPF